jgi:hypothetical protein
MLHLIVNAPPGRELDVATIQWSGMRVGEPLAVRAESLNVAR